MTHGDMEENVSGCFFLNTVRVVHSQSLTLIRNKKPSCR